MWLTIKICLSLLCILAFAFLTSAETAFDNVSELKTNEKAKNGDKKAKLVAKFIDNEKGIADCLKGLKILSGFFAVGFSVLAFSKYLKLGICLLLGIDNITLVRVSSAFSTLIVTLVVAFILYVTGEVFSKVISLSHPESSARKCINITYFFCKLVKPSYFILDSIWEGFSKLFGTNPDIDEEVTEEEIRQMVEAGEESGILLESQREIIDNIFEFDDISVSDVMNHRTEIIAVDVTENFDKVLKLAIDEGFSRIPVFEDDLDNIVGILYVKDLLRYVGKKLPEKISLKSIMREAYHVPQTKRCVELFKEMTERRIQMAVVIDEYGGTAGIVTLEDLIESVLGNIQDEYDNEEEEIQKVNETTFTIDGTCDIEEVDEILGTKLPDGDYDTLGGFILSVLGRIPKDDEHPSVEANGFKFTVMSIEDRRIESVKAEKTEKSEDKPL